MRLLLKHVFRRLKHEGLKQTIYRAGRFMLVKYFNMKSHISVFLIRLKQGNFVRRRVINCEIYLDLKDKGLSQDLLVYGIREPLSTEFLMKLITEGDVVVDIGANIGYYALLEAKLVGNKGKVYAVEPVPYNFELLEKNIELNRCSNIEAFQLAIGEKNASGTISITDKRNLSTMSQNTVQINRANLIDTVQVKVVTLDEFFKNRAYPDFIRMDVEGYEVEIIEGMKDILAHNNPLEIFMEIHSFIIRERGREMLRTLSRSGFAIKVAIWEPTLVKSSFLLDKMLNFVSSKINEDSYHPGYFYPTFDELREILMKPGDGIIRVFFERT